MVEDAARPDPDPPTSWARWLWTWSALATPLVCVAILVWSPSTVLVVAGVGAVVGALLAVGLVWDPAEPEVLRARLAGIPVLATSVAMATGFVALPMLSRAPALLVLSVAVAGLLSSPRLRRRLRRTPMAGPERRPEVAVGTSDPRPVETVGPVETMGPVETVEPVETVGPDVRAMTGEQLCTAWRHSFRTLEAARSMPERVRVVGLRQTFLDELETRHEPGLRAWLASGPRAASGPDRFLFGPVPTRTPAWPPNHAPATE